MPADRSLRRFALVTFVDSTGTSMYLTVAVVFFVKVLGLHARFVGLGLTVGAAAGLSASLPAGRLADRVGPHRVISACYLAEAALFAWLPFIHGEVEFVVVVTGIALAANGAGPAKRVLLSHLAGESSRVAASAYNRAVLNVGMGLGAAIAGGALAAGSHFAYDLLLIGNAASFVIAIAIVRTLPKPPVRIAQSNGEALGPPRSRHPLIQRRLVAAAFTCGTLYLSASVLDVGLALQVTDKTTVPHWMIAALLLTNTVLAVALQVRTSRGSESISGAATANRRAGIALLAACALFALSGHRPTALAALLLLAALLALTAGELLSSAGSWGLSYGMAPADRQGEYLASFGLISQGVQVAGPALAALVVSTGTTAWLTLGITFLVAGLATPLITASARSSDTGQTFVSAERS
ncbi:MAG TPA: MFS transporter [Mycobacteriales bacterium]|nr:MFS transporter [Mycobacteriales bacterium]